MNRRKVFLAAITVAFAALLVAGVSRSYAQHEHSSTATTEKSANVEGKPVTLEGEVVDLYCFMNHPETGVGPDHAKCAQTCMKKGLPIGFLSKGEVYLLLGKDHESVASTVSPFAGMQSRLKGTLITHNGVKGIELASIEPLSKEMSKTPTGTGSH